MKRTPQCFRCFTENLLADCETCPDRPGLSSHERQLRLNRRALRAWAWLTLGFAAILGAVVLVRGCA